jgi:hypothetical protein
VPTDRRRRSVSESVNAQSFRHLLVEFGIAAFRVVAHFMRLYFLLVEDFATPYPAPACQDRRALPPVHAHGEPAATSSTTHADSPIPSPCGRPTTPARPGLSSDRRPPAWRGRSSRAAVGLEASARSVQRFPKRDPPRRKMGLRGRRATSAHHSTRLAGSIRDRTIETSLAKSSAPIDNSIACRHAVMIFNPRHDSEPGYKR